MPERWPMNVGWTTSSRDSSFWGSIPSSSVRAIPARSHIPLRAGRSAVRGCAGEAREALPRPRCDRRPRRRPLAPGATPVVRASVSPAEPGFGTPSRTRCRCRCRQPLPARRPSRRSRCPHSRLADQDDPFRRARPRKRRRDERLACLVERCVAVKHGRAVTISAPRGRVGSVAFRGQPVSVLIRSRVPLTAVRAARPAFRRPSRPAALTPRVDPVALQAVLVASGLPSAHRRGDGVTLPLLRRGARRGTAGNVDPLRRAVRLLRESTARDGPDRRRAASHAGRLVGQTAVAVDAARVAWSRGDPGPRDVDALADRVEQEAGARE